MHMQWLLCYSHTYNGHLRPITGTLWCLRSQDGSNPWHESDQWMLTGIQKRNSSRTRVTKCSISQYWTSMHFTGKPRQQNPPYQNGKKSKWMKSWSQTLSLWWKWQLVPSEPATLQQSRKPAQPQNNRIQLPQPTTVRQWHLKCPP